MNEKILVIQTAFPGDAILTLPLIQELYVLFNNSQIDVICIPATAEIFSASPFVNKVIILDKKNSHKLLFSIIHFSKQIKKEKYNKVFTPHRSFRTSLIVLLSGIKDSTGFDISSISFIYANKIKYETKFHEVERNLRLISNYKNIINWNILPVVKAGFESHKKVEEYLTQFNTQKLAAVAPGSVWQTKIYPEEYYNKVISFLLSSGFTVVLIGGKSDSNVCDKIATLFEKNVISAAGKFSIVESIELLKKCELLVCNDSAPSHMAMSADIPAITIYCSTVPSFGFYPYNEKSSYVSFDNLECKPCGIHGHNKCPIKTFDCGWKLLPENVIEKIEEIIK